MKKVLLIFLLSFFSVVVGFYFWASSGFYDPEKYSEVFTFVDQTDFDIDTLSVCTYNIGYLSGMTNNLPVERSEHLFSKNLFRAKSVLVDWEFDLIGLQEVDYNAERSFNYNQFDSLGAAMEFYQGAYAVNWDKSYIPFPYFPFQSHFGKTLSGQGVLSKMQIVSNDLIVLEQPVDAPFYYKAFYLDRLIQLCKVKVREDTLVLMNVHLEAFDKKTRESQANRVLEVFNLYANDHPVLLIGDFNSRPPFAIDLAEQEVTIELFLNNPLIDEAISKERYLSDESRFFTFNTEEPYERLDYIFYNNNKIRKIDSDVLREAGDISDHLPVWMEFVIK